MKKIFTLFLIFALLFCFSGCRALARAEDAVENRIDGLEETVEQKVNDAANALLNPEPNMPDPNYTPVDPAQLISFEQAQTIALEHAGVAAEEATGLHTTFDMDDGRQEYDVEFRVGHLEYEYEIDAVTGSVLSYDKDR